MGAKWLGGIQIVGKAQRDVTRKISEAMAMGLGGGNRSLPCSSSFFFLATPTSRCTPISQHVEHANSKTPFFSSRYCMFCLLFMQLVSAVQKRKDKIWSSNHQWLKDRWRPVTYPGGSKLLGCKKKNRKICTRKTTNWLLFWRSGFYEIPVC